MPFDSTWTVKDSIEIDAKGDTTWIKELKNYLKMWKRSILHIRQIQELTEIVSRHAGFSKKFRWFNTEFRFSERIDKKLSSGYPVREFLNEEELNIFILPKV